MQFDELDGNQRKQLINTQQVHEAWLMAHFDRRHVGGMHWKTSATGRQYLYRTAKSASQKSLGPRSDKTEDIMRGHQQRLAELDDRLQNLTAKLEQNSLINKAYRLARVPLPTAKVLRRLKETPRIDNRLIVVGTNALYAYEAATGVQFPGEMTATEDLDLLWDARKQLALLLPEENVQGVFALLKSVDRSYERTMKYRAQNRDGFIVDIIRPELTDETTRPSPRISDDDGELEPSPIEGLQWLVNAPRFGETAIAEDGYPVHIATVDPRAFALHKLWLSHRPDRNPLKRHRDLAQAKAVADVAVRWLNLDFHHKDLSALPASLLAGLAQIQGKGA
jgi:hypothetical protein